MRSFAVSCLLFGMLCLLTSLGMTEAKAQGKGVRVPAPDIRVRPMKHLHGEKLFCDGTGVRQLTQLHANIVADEPVSSPNGDGFPLRKGR